MRSFRSVPVSRERPLIRSRTLGSVGVLALSFSIAGAVLPPGAQAQATARAPQSAARGWTSVVVRSSAGPVTPAQERAIIALGGYVTRHLPLIDSVGVRIPRRSASRLAALSFVGHVSHDDAVKKNDVFTVDSSEADAAARRYPTVAGDAVTVAVIDSGVLPVDDLKNTLGGTRVIATQDFIKGGTSPIDLYGHGTHIAGIIAGNGTDSWDPKGVKYSQTFRGIAPRANIVNVRVLDNYGAGTVSGVIAGIQWAVTNKTKYNIRVMNLSLGHPVGESYTTDPLCLAVEKAWKAGIVVVCAAGNEGRSHDYESFFDNNEGYGTNYGSIQTPGNSPYVITVGATKSINGQRPYDTVTTYSSRGPSRVDLVLKPDLVAPGNRVISPSAEKSYLATGFPNNIVPNTLYQYSGKVDAVSKDYFRLSGTSMSAPVVAAAAALMLQKDPTLTPDTVKARLMLSADKWGFTDGTTDPCTFGAGYVNIDSALQSTLKATQYTLSPTLSTDIRGNVYIDTKSLLGTRAIWGTGITDLRAIWGKQAIWGTSVNLLTSSRAIWGKTIWADRAIWGRSIDSVDLSATSVYGEN